MVVTGGVYSSPFNFCSNLSPRFCSLKAASRAQAFLLSLVHLSLQYVRGCLCLLTYSSTINAFPPPLSLSLTHTHTDPPQPPSFLYDPIAVIMVSRSSSASLSSFSFSYPSHTSSSSPSSPSSSPDSAPSSSQDRSCGASSASSTLSIVPFLWEEKPGVLKKEMQMNEGDEHKLGEGSPSLARRDGVVRAHRGDANVLSSKRLSKTFPTPRSKACSESLSPRLRPPPRLSQPEHPSSLPFHKRRHRRTPSLEDDPFWLAMVACTNDAGKGSRLRFKDRRENVEISRGDSWLAKKVHEHGVHFEQCMPRHVHAVSKGDHHGRRKELASRDVCTTKDEAASSTDGTVKSMSIHRNTHAHAHAHALHHRHHHHHCADGDAYSISLASKAFKALNIARAELHGRCKALLQQQSPPVDISCGNRLSKKRSHAPKHKLPDLFGCKNDDPLNLPPRFL